jgi:hypothetical protein
MVTFDAAIDPETTADPPATTLMAVVSRSDGPGIGDEIGHRLGSEIGGRR